MKSPLLTELRSVRNNTKGVFFILSFRTSSYFAKNAALRFIGLPVRLFYKLFVQWVLGIDVPDTTVIGRSFNMFHGSGLVINRETIIGKKVIVRHNTTIGNSREHGGCPRIGDNVNIGANSVIIGAISVGNNSTIAAGSVVIRDVPDNVIVAGNPAVVVKYLKGHEKV